MGQPENVTIYNVEKKDFETLPKVTKSESAWRETLSAEQFHVTRQHGTERAFNGALWNNKQRGIYRCIACGTDLFLSDTKYDSRTGWPSFWEPASEKNVGYTRDHTLAQERVEVHCARCGAHLGHVFDDGPRPTGKRFCINSVSLNFSKKE